MSADPSPSTPDEMRAALLQRFEAILSEQRGLDAGDRDSMMARLHEALDNADTLNAPLDPSRIQASVSETIGLLQQHGLMDQAGSQNANQAFERTFAVLQNDSVRKAMEFARISRERGEAQAREWLASQTRADAKVESGGPDAVPAHVAAAIGVTPLRR
jgi:hypothetical protein